MDQWMSVNSESGFWQIIKTILIIMLVSNVMKWILKTVPPNVDPPNMDPAEAQPDVHAAKESEQNAGMPEHVLRYKISLCLHFIRIMAIFQ